MKQEETAVYICTVSLALCPLRSSYGRPLQCKISLWNTGVVS